MSRSYVSALPWAGWYILAVFLWFATGACASDSTVSQAVRRCATPADVGIASASDIESAVIRFHSGETYQLTIAQQPELVEQLYKALLSLGAMDVSGMPGDDDLLILNSKDGTTATLCFCADNPAPREIVYYVNNTYHSPLLDSFLNSVRRNSVAASLRAGIPVKLGSLKIAVPSKPLVRVDTNSRQGKAIVTKAKSIIDCLDIRGAVPAVVGGDFEAATRKFGAVLLELDTAIRLDVYTSVTSPQSTCQGGYCLGLQHNECWCDSIVVMDYGNYAPPVVLLRGRDHPDYYFTADRLTRRAQEMKGVVEYGLPGHPVSDKDYYKTAEQLYKDLQRLVTLAYKVQNKRN